MQPPTSPACHISLSFPSFSSRSDAQLVAPSRPRRICPITPSSLTGVTFRRGDVCALRGGDFLYSLPFRSKLLPGRLSTRATSCSCLLFSLFPGVSAPMALAKS